MVLDRDTNYIVSGLERSGTSMLMQILKAADLPVVFDKKRPADDNNPMGYYELEGGKIINKLMENSFPFEKYKGNILKITAFGLRFLPPGKYKIIYSERNIEEILYSMEKMIGEKDITREETKDSFSKLNSMIKQIINERKDVDVLFINYNQILSNPKEEILKIVDFLGLSKDKIHKISSVVDNRLYRQRRKS